MNATGHSVDSADPPRDTQPVAVETSVPGAHDCGLTYLAMTALYCNIQRSGTLAYLL